LAKPIPSREENMKTPLILITAAALTISLGALTPQAADLVTDSQLARSVELRNVTASPDGEISGTIVNRTNHEIRDVKLMVDYAWVWNNDFRPGEDNPGRTVFITAPASIPPHGEGSFTYKPSPPLQFRDDGHFVPSVHIVGFTQMIPPGA
jgi:hypothetical protein